MSRVSVTVVLLLALVGCGGGSSDALQGIWTTPLLKSDCVAAVTFANGTAEQDEICPLDNGSIGVELTTGPYTISGSNVTVDETSSTCPTDTRASHTFAFTQTGTTLRLTTIQLQLVLQKTATSPTASGIIAFGCFDDNYAFTPSPLHTLPAP